MIQHHPMVQGRRRDAKTLRGLAALSWVAPIYDTYLNPRVPHAEARGARGYAGPVCQRASRAARLASASVQLQALHVQRHQHAPSCNSQSLPVAALRACLRRATFCILHGTTNHFLAPHHRLSLPTGPHTIRNSHSLQLRSILVVHT